MGNIVKHQCPSCGGNLSVDNDKQMYRCTFCGSTYDYEYFREEQIHDMGETYLSRREFMAAVDAYRFVLKKDPHDFIALKGLMLASAHMRNMDDLISKDNDKGFKYNSKLVSEAVSGALDKDKEYFEDLGKIYSDMKRKSDCRNEVESLGKDRRRIEDTIRIKEKACNEYNYRDQYGNETAPKNAFYTLFGVNGLLILFTVIGAVALSVSGQGRTAVVVAFFSVIANAILLVVNFKFVYSRVKAVTSLESEINDLHSEFGRISNRISMLNDEKEKLADDVKHAVFEFVKKDTLVINGKA